MEQEKQQLRDMANGSNLALMLMQGVNRSVQIWSRVPGTTGTWFFGLLFFQGMLIQAWYYQVNVVASKAPDSIPISVSFGLSLIWFAYHGVKRNIYRANGMRFHSYDPGIGILYRAFPNWQPATIDIASDLSVAIALSLLMLVAGSPIQSGWYRGMCIWLVVIHLWNHARDFRRLRALEDAQLEAAYWSEQVRRRRT